MLNLMPCVFPVLAIKVLGFTRPGTTARAHRASGLAYTAGVVLSFVLLGALLMGLRAAGEQLGWGFQLQSPWTVSALAMLFTLLGLNLAGLFEFGQLLPSAVMNLQSRRPTLDAALSGVLAVAIASPCTAPFMGASMGLAIGLPLWQALPVFAAMGLGMALPYLGASLWPALAQRLPRPGAWMVTFRQAMAFPMFATVVWLLWVLGQQTGIDGAASLLALLVALTALVWALGLQGRARAILGLLALAAALGIGWSPLRQALQEPAAAAITSANSERWAPWSASELSARQAQGQTVFVDFTAAWCVTCQYNKKTTLADTRVLAAFDAKNVRTLRADWTRRDPAITQALAQLGRSGVPVYAVYAPGKPAVVLSELPSVDEVLNALP
jgi:thiol:disulfide interchange protein DsbD